MEAYIPLVISLSAGGLGTAVVAWISMSIRVAVLQTELKNVKEDLIEEKLNNSSAKNSNDSKIDSILSKINHIEIMIAKNFRDEKE